MLDQRVQTGNPSALVRALGAPRVEVLPFADTAEHVAKHLPAGSVVPVTASPRRGIEPTLRISEALARDGYRAVPHLAARLVRDRDSVYSLLRRLAAAGIDDAFVIGGDGAHPVGAFDDALGLLQAMHDIAERGYVRLPSRLGIAAYPEGHSRVGEEALRAALLAKQPLATYAVTQLCFDPPTVTAFLADLRRGGFRLPVYAGVPGRVDRRTLLRISGRIGVGDSARFLRKHRHGMLRMLLPRAYDPDRLVRGLASDLSRPQTGLAGLHLYSFGDIASTEGWRRGLLDELSRPGGDQ
ncbi:MAG: hypothetical protein ACR2K3_01550 [Nocardioides sp.]